MICTFLSQSSVEAYSKVDDKDLNELFQEVRQKFDNSYLISTHTYLVKSGIFSKAKPVVYYVLFSGHGPEYQEMNLGGGINTNQSKQTIMAYFYGLLNGQLFEQGKTK